MRVKYHDYLFGCHGKTRYNQPIEAHRVLRYSNLTRKRRDREQGKYRKMTVYRCTACGGWHLGNPQ
jgi:hypothetical protein